MILLKAASFIQIDKSTKSSFEWPYVNVSF